MARLHPRNNIRKTTEGKCYSNLFTNQSSPAPAFPRAQTSSERFSYICMRNVFVRCRPGGTSSSGGTSSVSFGWYEWAKSCCLLALTWKLPNRCLPLLFRRIVPATTTMVFWFELRWRGGRERERKRSFVDIFLVPSSWFSRRKKDLFVQTQLAMNRARIFILMSSTFQRKICEIADGLSGKWAHCQGESMSPKWVCKNHSRKKWDLL